MTTPSEEEEARTAAEALFPYRPYAVRHFIEGYLAALASRVSTPPSEDWEYVPGHRWEDRSGNEQWFVQNGTIAPGYVQDYIAEGGKVIRRRVGPWEPVPAVPVLPTEPAPSDPKEEQK